MDWRSGEYVKYFYQFIGMQVVLDGKEVQVQDLAGEKELEASLAIMTYNWTSLQKGFKLSWHLNVLLVDITCKICPFLHISNLQQRNRSK